MTPGDTVPIVTFANLPVLNEVTYAERRLTTRTYASKSFTAAFGQDRGHASWYIYKVFDEVVTDDDDEWDWTNEVVFTSPGGRKQLQVQVTREAGAVRKLRIQKVPTSGDRNRLENVLELDRDQATRLIDMLRAIDVIPIEGGNTVRVDDQLLRDVFADPTAITSVYANNPERFRALIESDANASDVIALQHRRDVAATTRQWLEDDGAFAEASAAAGGPEKAWQQLLEANPWVLGIGLGGQLLTSWEEGQLEQTVVGRSIKGVGKRVDALLRTAGIGSAPQYPGEITSDWPTHGPRLGEIRLEPVRHRGTREQSVEVAFVQISGVLPLVSGLRAWRDSNPRPTA